MTVILRAECLRDTYYDGRIAKNLKNTHYKKCDIWHLDNLMLKAMPTGARAGEELCLQQDPYTEQSLLYAIFLAEGFGLSSNFLDKFTR